MKVHRPSTSPTTEEVTSKNIWHLLFSDVERKLTTFLKGGLWLARLDEFKEPTEASLPDANLGLLVKAGTELIPWIQKQYAREVRAAYASCWHMSDGDPTPYAWDHFGLGGRGLAIKTTPEAMISALQPYIHNDGPTYFSAVQYVNHHVDHPKETIQPENVVAAALTVSSRFREEREARALVHLEGSFIEFLAAIKSPFGPLIIANPTSGKTDEPPAVGGVPGSKGTAIVLQVDPELFVQEIVLGPKMENDTRAALIHLIQEHHLEHKLRR